MGWFWSKPKSRDVIDVKMFDASTNELIAQSPVPIDRLPASFEAETTMHVGEQDWLVVEARPMTAEEFRKTRKLLLRVSKVGKLESIDPKKILFSLPTISDELYGIAEGTSKLNKDVLEITEDDTRQVEFVDSSLSSVVEEEVRAIEAIYETARKGPGFSQLHVRKAVPIPLPSEQLTIAELLNVLPRSIQLDGLSYHRMPGLVSAGFSIRLFSSITLYGLATPEGGIRNLCIAHGTLNNAASQDIEQLAAIAAAHNLLLVDWCRCAIIPPIAGEYQAYFTERMGG